MNSIDFAGQLLWTQLWQATLLLVFVGIAHAFLARKRPHLVYLLWMIFFVKCLTPPILQSPVSVFSWVPPSYSLVAKMESDKLPKALPEFEYGQKERHKDDTAAKKEFTGEITSLRFENEVPNQASVETAPLDADIPLAETSDSILPQQPEAAVLSTPTPPIRWDRIAIFGWMFGVCILLFAVLVQWIAFFGRIRHHRQPTPPWLVEQTQAIAKRLGVRRTIQMVITDASVGPFVVGAFRPRIVLPTHMLEDSFRANLDSILAHELCHVRRGDPMVSLLQCAAQILFWFHPAVWWACRQANRLCELCCDEETIESLQIRKRDYAKSLLAVVDSKRKLRPVWATSGMSQAENTKQRLREIMKSKKRIEKTPLWCRLIAAALLLTVLPSSGYDHVLMGQEDEINIQSIRQALGSGDLAAAEKMCRQLIEEDDQNAMAIHLLGFTLHGAGKLDEAAKYHKRATEFDATRALGFYNLACVHALKGEPDDAIAKLKKSMKAGLVLQTPITSDTDFESMYDHPEFKKIAAKLSDSASGTQTAGRRPTNKPDASSSLAPFAFWVGSWEVVNTDGEVVGHNKITMEEAGNLMRERWTSLTGGTGQSINYFDPDSGMVKQTWVDSKGQVLEMKGKASDGQMKMSGSGTIMGRQVLCKMLIKKMDDGRVKQSMKISKDDGENWEIYFEGFYQRDSDGGSK